MKNFLVCFLIFLVQIGYSQKKYHLDYALDFEISSLEDGEMKKRDHIYFVNSKKNGIIMCFHEHDAVHYDINFSDREKLSIFSKVKKSDFFKVESIINTCESAFKFNFSFHNKVKKYEFINLNDTIIDGIPYFHYKSTSVKKRKKKNDYDVHYIIDKSSPDFLPFLINNTAYELWKKNQNIPNGLPFMIYNKNNKGLITYKMELKECAVINRFMIIPNDCELQVKKTLILNFK